MLAALLEDRYLADVLVALIVGLPAIIGALRADKAAKRARETLDEIKTPSGDTLGTVMERTHDTAIANNLVVTATGQAHTAKLDEIHVLVNARLEEALRKIEAFEQRYGLPPDAHPDDEVAS